MCSRGSFWLLCLRASGCNLPSLMIYAENFKNQTPITIHHVLSHNMLLELDHIRIPPRSLLLQDHVGGLEVRDKHGEWMQVKPIPHAFVINLGDQLEVRVNNHHELLLLLMRCFAAATLIFLSIVRCELDICCNRHKTCSTCKQATQENLQLVEDPAFLHFFAQRIVMYVATGINLVLLAC